jgi:hypothetical protein
VTNYETVMEFIDNRVCDSGYQARYDAALTALEEMRRDSGRLADVRRALIEITEYSTGWTHGQFVNCEGMCLLRIDDLARSVLNSMKGGDAPRPQYDSESKTTIPTEGRSDAPEDRFAAAGVSAYTIRETKAQEQSTAGASAQRASCIPAKGVKIQGPWIPFYQEAQPPECAARKALSYQMQNWDSENRPSDARSYVAEVQSLESHCDELRAENERLTVQLAGCSVAAEGGTKDPATRDQWGWSPAYQEVLDLRIKYDASTQEVTTLRAKLHDAYRELYDALRARDLAREASNRDLEAKRAAEREYENERRGKENMKAQYENVIDQLSEQVCVESAGYTQLRAALATEKETRVKYQDIVYTACNLLDRQMLARKEEVVSAIQELIRQRFEALQNLATEKAAREITEADLVDVRGAWRIQKAAREKAERERDEWCLKDAARINENGEIAAIEHERAEKAEAALAEAADIIQGYMDGPQSWSELNRRLDRAAAFVAAHSKEKEK